MSTPPRTSRIADTVEGAMRAARQLASSVERILAPREILAECRRIADDDPRLARVLLGQSGRGEPIEAYTFGSGRRQVLLYGFPDPGEAIGGTTILALIRSLLSGHPSLAQWDLTWTFIPCLNLDDQPAGGRELRPIRKDPAASEVDWSLRTPRPETTALLGFANAAKPIAIFPLHDELHSGEELPVYLPVSRPLDPRLCEAIRAILTRFGFRIDETYRHPTMGTGFFVMEEETADFSLSTFSVLAAYGLVLICELARRTGMNDAELVAAQLAVILLVLHSLAGGGKDPD